MLTRETMRHKLNLDLRSVDRIAMLIHSAYGAGKTYLVGDMLKAELERTKGPVLFVNVKGEDGTLSLADMGLGDVGETVETLTDWKELVADAHKRGLKAIGVDSMKALVRLVMRDKIGVDRPPEKTEYGIIHWVMENLATELRTLASVVLCVCPSDKSVNQLDGRTYITPDLPGREAAGSAGWFDFVGYLKADTLSPKEVTRAITFAPNASIITRQRLPKPITHDISIPTGKGGWAAIRGAIEKALQS